MSRIPAAAVLAWALLVASSASAQSKRLVEPHDWELSGMLGVHIFSDTVELGVPDTIDTAHPETGPTFGLRGLYKFRADFGVEVEVTMTPTEASIEGDSISVFGWRIHLVVPLGYKFWRFESQLVAGVGGITTTGDGVHARADEIASDTDLLPHWGVTGRLKLGDTWHLRADARHLLVPSTDFSFPFTNDFELSVGVAFRFGGGGPLDVGGAGGDRDGDGVVDRDDRCDGEKEDFDGFEDGDGCPDPDNDGDGIDDESDLCPLEAETVNGYEDADGCPDQRPPAPEPVPGSAPEPPETSGSPD
jgi:hypothetical protein